MPYKKYFALFTITLIILSWCTITAFGAVDIPAPEMHVADRANIIEEQTENSLNNFLAELEMKTGTQMVVLTVNTTGGMPIDQFSIDVANQWELGQSQLDNGVLVVIANEDRKYRIEVGSGLETVIPNSFCEEIGTILFTPNFRNGNYNEGIYQGSIAIINKIANDIGVTISGAPKEIHLPRRRSSGLSFLPILLIFILPLLLSGRRRAYGRSRWGGMPFFMMMPFMFGGFGGGGHHSEGDSFSSGGFGGFGGGLGGGFGGGGFSGGW
jgi:uncharacterized protein